MSVSPQRQLGWSNISIKRAPQKMASRRMVSYGLKLADWNGAEVRFGSKADIVKRLDDIRFTPKSGHSPA
jgi:hypothetical protein